MRKKKQLAAFMLLTAMLLNLTACVKTPEENIVTDKSKGLSEENIIPKEKDGKEKQLNIPEHWKETITRKDGFITVEADDDISIGNIYNTPVYVYKIRKMDRKLLENLCSYFAEGSSLYEDPGMTKEELIAEKEKMTAGIGNWGSYDANYMASMVGSVENLIKNADEKRTEPKEIKAELRIPLKNGMEWIGKSWCNATHKRTWNNWYFETDKNIGFTARVAKGRKVDPVIRAISYDNEIGSTTAFAYRQGTFIDERELNLEWELEHAFQYGNEEYLSYLSENMEHVTDENFTEKDAVKMAKSVLKELSITEMDVGECVKAIGNTDSESWAGVGTDDTQVSSGYAVYFSVKAGDVVGYPLTLASKQYENLAETVYAPSFITEGIRMIVTKEGIQLFEWTDISKKTDVIAENTKLLTFDEIKEKLADHLLYAQIANLGGISPEGFANIYTVKNVQLRAANINAYNKPKRSWLVPVWVFDVEGKMQHKTGKEITTENIGPDTVVLNAIDGGFIQVQRR